MLVISEILSDDLLVELAGIGCIALIEVRNDAELNATFVLTLTLSADASSQSVAFSDMFAALARRKAPNRAILEYAHVGPSPRACSGKSSAPISSCSTSWETCR